MRCALVGFGLAGRVFHAPFIAATDGLELSWVVTGDPARAAAAAQEHPAARVVARLDDVWPEAPDLVVVAAPNRFHVPLARAAIDHGVAVVVDKPLAPAAADARALVTRAAAAGVPLVPFHNRRWDDDLLTLRRLLDEGALGRVHRFESRFERWRPEVADGWREEGDPSAGGGVLLDLGPHLVDQALLLFGDVVEVHGEVDVRRPGARVDDDAFVALHHAGGVRSHLWMSAAAADQGPRLRVLGSAGAFVVEGLDPQEAALREGWRPGAGPGPGPPRHGVLTTARGTREVALDPGDYGGFYRSLLGTLRDGAPPPVDARDAVRGLELLSAVRTES